MPTFVVAGAMRSGTSSLISFLRPRSDVFIARKKELHYFDRHYRMGSEWYSRQFDPGPGQLVVGEATPNYMYETEACTRMGRDLSEARFVILLRNPVERAYSHYWLAREHGREDLSFEDAVSEEPGRLRGADPVTRAFVSYVDRGRYIDQIEHLTCLVGGQRVGIWIYEEMCAEQDRVLREILAFLGARSDDDGELTLPLLNDHRRVFSPWLRTQTKRLPKRLGNAVGRLNSVRRSYPPMQEGARRDLEELYAPYSHRLELHLGRSVPAWSRSQEHGS